MSYLYTHPIIPHFISQPNTYIYQWSCSEVSKSRTWPLMLSSDLSFHFPWAVLPLFLPSLQKPAFTNSYHTVGIWDIPLLFSIQYSELETAGDLSGGNYWLFIGKRDNFRQHVWGKIGGKIIFKVILLFLSLFIGWLFFTQPFFVFVCGRN